MALIEGFDASQVEIQEFAPLPAGWYEGMAIASEWGESSTSENHYIKFTFQILSGEYEGRQLFDFMTMKGANETSEKIGREHLAMLCKAVNNLRPKDTEDLHNLPVMIKVGLRKETNTGEVRNQIKEYKAKTAVTAPQPNVPASSNTVPWKR